MSRGLEGRLSAFEGFPRVSGDEPLIICVVRHIIVFSPRERG